MWRIAELFPLKEMHTPITTGPGTVVVLNFLFQCTPTYIYYIHLMIQCSNITNVADTVNGGAQGE